MRNSCLTKNKKKERGRGGGVKHLMGELLTAKKKKFYFLMLTYADGSVDFKNYETRRQAQLWSH